MNVRVQIDKGQLLLELELQAVVNTACSEGPHSVPKPQMAANECYVLILLKVLLAACIYKLHIEF